jgi:microcompartment protein CcmL/EutN
VSTDGPALGLLELCSIARGVRTCDAMVKKAPVRLIRAGSTHPGKYVILIRGGVDEVDEALGAGRQVAAESLIDEVFLPNPHDQLLEVLDAPLSPALEAVGVLETFSVASTIRGADASLKAAEVQAVRIGLAQNLGGKGYFVLTGALHDVEAAIDAGRAAVTDGLLAGCEIVANPHPDLVDALG